MNNRIQTAFSNIHADETLKVKTKAAVLRRTKTDVKTAHPGFRRYAAISACIFVLTLTVCIFISYRLPIAAVSIDTNPSVELQINIYDRVISVKGYNEDGIAIAQNLSVKNMHYTDAINLIINSQSTALSPDSLTEITIACRWRNKSDELKSCIFEQTEIAEENIYFLYEADQIDNAHLCGISFGKYRAYLELSEIDPDISIEEIKGLTMRQIRDMINEYTEEPPHTNQQGNHGNDNDYGNGNSYGNDNGNANGNGYGNGNGDCVK